MLLPKFAWPPLRTIAVSNASTAISGHDCQCSFKLSDVFAIGDFRFLIEGEEKNDIS